jgi:hypothetical protein
VFRQRLEQAASGIQACSPRCSAADGRTVGVTLRHFRDEMIQYHQHSLSPSDDIDCWTHRTARHAVLPGLKCLSVSLSLCLQTAAHSHVKQHTAVACLSARTSYMLHVTITCVGFLVGCLSHLSALDKVVRCHFYYVVITA